MTLDSNDREATQLTLVAAPPPDDHVLTVTEETVLRVWGRAHNMFGPKPPTYRRVRRVIVEEVTEHWCTGCDTYLPPEAFAPGKPWCRSCRRRRDLTYVTPERRERMKWRAHRRRAQSLRLDASLTYEEWTGVIAAHNGRCAVVGCGADYEEMDHVVRYKDGGTHTPDNLQPLCRRHHDEKTAVERRRDRVPTWAEERL